MSALPISSEMTGEPRADTTGIGLTPETNAAARSGVRRQIIRSSGVLAITLAFAVLRSFAEYEGLTVVQLHDSGKPSVSPPQLALEKPRAPSPSIRVTNPFDASEVFEFPPGTPRAEAREFVANVLLQRARERRPQWGAIKRKARQQVSAESSPS